MTSTVTVPEVLAPYVTTDEGGIRLPKCGDDGLAMAALVSPDKMKYLAWHAFFLAGLDKAPLNRHRTSYRLFFLVDGVPEGADTSIVDKGTFLFLSGCGFPIPVDEWIGELPDKLPFVSYADVKILMGVKDQTAEVMQA